MDCNKFIYFGYESRRECLLATQTNDGDVSTEPNWTDPRESTNTINPFIIIMITVVGLLAFGSLLFCIFKWLVVRQIVKIYLDHMKRPFKPAKNDWVKKTMKNIKTKDYAIEYLQKLSQIKKMFMSTTLDSDEEANTQSQPNIVTVSSLS